MNAIKYYGVFRGIATMPIAAFAVEQDARGYARRLRASVKVCYMNCGYRCPECGGMTLVEPTLPCDDCELADGCTLQPFTPECKEARK